MCESSLALQKVDDAWTTLKTHKPGKRTHDNNVHRTEKVLCTFGSPSLAERNLWPRPATAAVAREQHPERLALLSTVVYCSELRSLSLAAEYDFMDFRG